MHDIVEGDPGSVGNGEVSFSAHEGVVNLLSLSESERIDRALELIGRLSENQGIRVGFDKSSFPGEGTRRYRPMDHLLRILEKDVVDHEKNKEEHENKPDGKVMSSNADYIKIANARMDKEDVWDDSGSLSIDLSLRDSASDDDRRFLSQAISKCASSIQIANIEL